MMRRLGYWLCDRWPQGLGAPRVHRWASPWVPRAAVSVPRVTATEHDAEPQAAAAVAQMAVPLVPMPPPSPEGDE